MYKLIAVVTVSVLLLCCCDTKNVGTGGLRPLEPIVLVQVPADLRGGETAVWTATWSGGRSPFLLSIDLGGGAVETVTREEVPGSPASWTFTMINPSAIAPASYTYQVTLEFGSGLSTSATGQYSVAPRTNSPPVIDSAVFTKSGSSGELDVTVSDPDDGETLTVSVTEPAGLAVDALSKQASATGPQTASFGWAATDFVAGGSGTTTVTVTDSAGASDSEDVYIDCTIMWLIPDSLFAVAMPTTVAVGEPVTVIVLTSDPANPFQYLNGVGLTIESDADYVAQSFDVGAVGGSPGEADGVWALMNPSGFFSLDPFYVGTDIGGGRERWDFNVTPVGGSDLPTGEGALFNVQFTFSEPGTKHFGFQQHDGEVNRTYYSDSTATEYFWGDISNSAAPTVVVE